MSFFSFLEHLSITVIIVIVVRIWIRDGVSGLVYLLLQVVKALPGGPELINLVLSNEVKTFTQQIKSKGQPSGKQPAVSIPLKGVPKDELLKEMEKLKACDGNAEDGKMFAYVYTAESDNFKTQQQAFNMFWEKTGHSPEHDDLVRTFHHAFMHENALNPVIFPSLRRFENEVISMSASMLNGDSDVVGSMTSGGTESILMAMKAYRDRARKLFPQIKDPEMVAPITIHPAHEKAANYFGFKIIHIPVGADFRPNVKEFEKAITPNTIALLASAPQYCHGVIDPIEELSEVAVRRSLPLHVDACFGGFMLPWVEKLGYPIPKFDFRNPGVTTMTADIHKYGYGAKGSSVVLYRNAEFRKFQIFAYSQWPGGLFGSPSMAGTRPGGNLAAAWVALKGIGQEGYMSIAKELMNTTKKLREGVNSIPGLQILGNPDMTSLAIGSSDPNVNILAVADVLEKKGFKPERQQCPDSLHMTIMPHHIKVADDIIEALRDSAKTVKEDKSLAKVGTAAMYGMVGQIPDKTVIDDFIVEFFSEVYKL